MRRLCSAARAIPKSVSFTVISPVGGSWAVRPRAAACRGAADHHQVPRLDVAVDDPLAVGVVEPGAGLDADLDGGLGPQASARLQQLRSGAALHVLHDDVVAVLVDAGVVDLDDVRVDQLRDRQRLAPEAGDELVVVREVLGEDLDRDGALQDPVGRLVDARHPARAEPVAELVAARDQGRAHRQPPPTPVPPVPPSSAATAGRAAAGVSCARVAVALAVSVAERRCRCRSPGVSGDCWLGTVVAWCWSTWCWSSTSCRWCVVWSDELVGCAPVVPVTPDAVPHRSADQRRQVARRLSSQGGP